MVLYPLDASAERMVVAWQTKKKKNNNKGGAAAAVSPDDFLSKSEDRQYMPWPIWSVQVRPPVHALLAHLERASVSASTCPVGPFGACKYVRQYMPCWPIWSVQVFPPVHALLAHLERASVSRSHFAAARCCCK